MLRLEAEKQRYIFANRDGKIGVTISFTQGDLLHIPRDYSMIFTVKLPFPRLNNDILGWIRKYEKSLLDI